MPVKEWYEAMGGDYDDGWGRLRTYERVQKILLKTLDDKSYALLTDSVEAGNMSEAFRAAHTIKGVCQNLSITPLYKSASELAELLRNADAYSEDMESMIEEVKKDYTHMIECIRQLA